MTRCIPVHGKIHHKHYLHSCRHCDSNKVKTLPVCDMGYLVVGLWLQIPLEVIWLTKGIFVFAPSLWCYKSLQSLAHHFVVFIHHVICNILISVTLKMTVFWNLQPAVWCNCTDLPDCMASHSIIIFVMKLIRRL
jgi:hypothetical protein